MKNRRKLLDLTAKRATHVAAADAALDTNDQAAYTAAMAEVSNLDTQITQIHALITAQEATPAVPPAGATPTGTSGTPSDDATARRASNEYARAFCSAVRARVAPASADPTRFGVLLDAMTEGVPEDGGFLVPVDLQTRINELRRQMVTLRDLVTVEPVTTLTGYRVIDTAPTKGFALVAEMGQIPLDDQPAFSRVPYSVKDYGLIVPISNDLLSDNDAGLLEYLARWMAKKSTITENKIILTLLGQKAPQAVVAGKELASIKTALNVTLDPDIALNAVLLTNQGGYNCLDQLVDDKGRPILQPDITAGSGYQIKQRPVKMASDKIMPNIAGGSLMYVGDLMQYITLFDRQVMEFTTTNVGGDAWRTNSTEGRAIMRLDAKVMDNEAVEAMVLAGGLDAAG